MSTTTSTKTSTKAARRAANRGRGFPLSWLVEPAPAGQGCQGQTRRKRDQHTAWPYLIATGRGADGNSIACTNCCTHQQGKAITWAASRGGRAEAFR